MSAEAAGRAPAAPLGLSPAASAELVPTPELSAPAALEELAPATGAPAGDDERRAMCDLVAAWVDGAPDKPPAWDEERWAEFRLVAQVHGVAPLLGCRLAARPAWESTAVGSWLAAQAEASRRRAARLAADLREVLPAFDGAGVPVMPLKGMALAALYQDVAERPMADLDLLVAAADLERAVALLGEVGYEPVFAGRKHVKLLRPDNRAIVDEGSEHPDNPRPIELHPACGEWLDEERIELTPLVWASARAGEVAGTPAAWLPAPEAHWCYLLVHGCHHLRINRFRLLQLLDLRLLEPAALAGDVGRVGGVGGVGGIAAQLLGETMPPEGAPLARAVYPPLALLDRYDPSPARRAARAPLRQALRRRLPSGFAAWADGLDLFDVCHLCAAPWRAE